MSRKSTKTTTVANITLPVRKMDFTEATKEFRTLCRNFYTDFEKVAGKLYEQRKQSVKNTLTLE